MSEVNQYDEKIAKMEITVDNINQNVGHIADLVREVNSHNILSLENCAQGNILELRIKGNMNLLFPSKKIFPSKKLLLKNSYLRVVYEDNTFERYFLPINHLWSYQNIYDEFVINNEETYLIKRIGKDLNGNYYILSNEEIITFDLIEILLKKGINKIYLESFPNNINFYGKYATKSDLTDSFALKTEVKAEVNIAKNDVLIQAKQEITDATDTDTLIGKINIKPGMVDITGVVTANEKFKILQNGTMKAVDGEFEGDVTANNLYLRTGGKVIGENGLMTNLIYPGTVSSSNFIITGDFSNLGFSILRETYDSNYNPIGVVCKKDQISFSFCLPKSFIITEAKIFLQHIPMRHYANDGYTVSYDRMGYSRNLRLYKKENISYRQVNYVGDVPENINSSLIEIPSAFGSTGFNPSSSGLQSTESIDIKNYIKTNGVNNLIIQSANTVPSNTDSAREQTGACMATLQIIGYTKFDL